jgi:uncharacterized protein YjbI with pentapeptide repeats
MLFLPLYIAPVAVMLTGAICTVCCIKKGMNVLVPICVKAEGEIAGNLNLKPFSDLSKKELNEKLELECKQFVFMNLNDLNLRYKDFINCEFTASFLKRIRAKGANFRNACFKYANLNFARLKDANLNSAELLSASLVGANLNKADLVDSDMRNADLNHAFLKNADLHDANLEGADLSRANLCGANLKGTNLEKANLFGALFSVNTELPFSIEQALDERMLLVTV